MKLRPWPGILRQVNKRIWTFEVYYQENESSNIVIPKKEIKEDKFGTCPVRKFKNFRVKDVFLSPLGKCEGLD